MRSLFVLLVFFSSGNNFFPALVYVQFDFVERNIFLLDLRYCHGSTAVPLCKAVRLKKNM